MLLENRMRVAATVILSPEQRQQLETLARGRRVQVRVAERAEVVLLAAAGKQDIEIAEHLGMTRQKAARWRARFLRLGIAGIQKDAPRSGTKQRLSAETILEVVRKTTQDKPENATHWSTPSLSRALKISASSVGRIWRAHGLKPHLVKTFKVSNDPHFAEKLADGDRGHAPDTSSPCCPAIISRSIRRTPRRTLKAGPIAHGVHIHDRRPAGYLADKGRIFAARSHGQSYGWSFDQAGRQQVRNSYLSAEFDTTIRMRPTPTDTTGTWEIALANGTYPVVVVMGDPLSRAQTNHLTIEGVTYTDPDPDSSPGYQQGDFDGYWTNATVTDGRLTLQVAAGAVDPKLCFIEIGPAGGSVDAAAQARLADTVARANAATWDGARESLVGRRYVYASYVDEPVMMVSGAGTKHYFHQNHLYSVAAMTDSAGAVVERYRYDAYGKRTVTNAAGTPIAASTIGQQRGFTGYSLDAETGLYYARARMYSAGLGRFIGRDPLGYVDGFGLYSGYFVPNGVDPSGTRGVYFVRAVAKSFIMPVKGKIGAIDGEATVNPSLMVLAQETDRNFSENPMGAEKLPGDYRLFSHYYVEFGCCNNDLIGPLSSTPIRDSRVGNDPPPVLWTPR